MNNHEKASANILMDRNVYAVNIGGMPFVVIQVPRADFRTRPVYIGKDVFEGTYRRNGEGDYKCARNAVLAMLRDCCEVTYDAAPIEDMGLGVFCVDTISSYRNRFGRIKPASSWNKLPDDEFLLKVKAAKSVQGRIHPTVAGLICFGEFNTITDVMPNYFLDYRERLTTETRWSDRVCAHDSTWSGNIYDFFFKLHDRIVSDVKNPFALEPDNITARQETDIHKSIRELVANALIHADYHGVGGIVIDKCFRSFTFANPGSFLQSKLDAISGGNSLPRNQTIFNIFAQVNIGERSGSGLSDLYARWKEHAFVEPEIEEKFDPDRVTVRISCRAAEELTQTKTNSMPTDPKLTQNCPKSDPKLTQTINDLSAATRQVLFALQEDCSLTLRGLASKIKLSKTTVTTAVGTLIEKKLIRRVGTNRTGHWEIIK